MMIMKKKKTFHLSLYNDLPKCFDVTHYKKDIFNEAVHN